MDGNQKHLSQSLCRCLFSKRWQSTHSVIPLHTEPAHGSNQELHRVLRPNVCLQQCDGQLCYWLPKTTLHPQMRRPQATPASNQMTQGYIEIGYSGYMVISSMFFFSTFKSCFSTTLHSFQCHAIHTVHFLAQCIHFTSQCCLNSKFAIMHLLEMMIVTLFSC